MKHLVLSLFIISCSTSPFSTDEARRHHPDAAVPADASSEGDGGYVGNVTCYSSGAPSRTCPLSSQHCCFNLYDSSQNGGCESSSSSCLVGTIDCDGSEDCAAGTQCFAHHWYDASGMPHWMVACSATAPDPMVDRLLCHPGDSSCPAGKACTQTDAAGTYDLPQTIYVCN